MGKGPQETVLEFWPYLSVLSCQASGLDAFDRPGAQLLVIFQKEGH